MKHFLWNCPKIPQQKTRMGLKKPNVAPSQVVPIKLSPESARRHLNMTPRGAKIDPKGPEMAPDNSYGTHPSMAPRGAKMDPTGATKV
jgi:hypothetical protein